MRWAAGGLAYACALLYLLTTIAGAVVALIFHLLVLAAMALLGLLVLKFLWPRDRKQKTSPE